MNLQQYNTTVLNMHNAVYEHTQELSSKYYTAQNILSNTPSANSENCTKYFMWRILTIAYRPFDLLSLVDVRKALITLHSFPSSSVTL